MSGLPHQKDIAFLLDIIIICDIFEAPSIKMAIWRNSSTSSKILQGDGSVDPRMMVGMVDEPDPMVPFSS